MKTAKEIYKKIGLTKVKHFINPKIIDGDEFIFPKKSLMHFLKVSNILDPVTKGVPYLSNVRNAIVIPVIEYSKEDLIGKFIYRHDDGLKAAKENYKKEKRFKFNINPNGKVRMNDNKLILITYGTIGPPYHYTSNPLNMYYRWHNTLLTAAKYLNGNTIKSSRDIYINIDIPIDLPTFRELEYDHKHITTNVIKRYNDYTKYNLLELWNLLNHERNEEHSLFFKYIPQSNYSDITFIFTIDNKMMLVNMYMLLSVVKEYSIESNLAKYPSVTVRKLLYKMLSTFIIKKPTPMSVIDKEDKLSNNSIIDINNDSVEKVNINNLIDTSVDEATTVSKKGDDIELDNDLSGIDLETTLSDEIDEIYADIKELVSDKYSLTDEVVRKISHLEDDNLLTSSKAEEFKSIIDNQSKIKSPYEGDTTKLSDMLDIEKDKENDLTEEDTILPDTPSVIDKSLNRDVVNVLESKYIQKQYGKDIVRTVYGMQNAGLLVEKYYIDEKASILGETEIHTIQIKPLTGRSSSIKIILPKIKEDGTFKLSGNIYRMKKQKNDIPFRKINSTQIALSSYYGKVFINKSVNKSDDAGYWFLKQLNKIEETDKKLSNIVAIGVKNIDSVLPQDYNVISRYIKSFRYGNLTLIFDYNTRGTLFEDPDDILKIEDKNNVIVGVKSGIPVLMNIKDNTLTLQDKDKTNLGTIYQILNINKNLSPIEYSSIKIYKIQLPIIIMLSYKLGLNNLLKLLNIKYRIIDSGTRANLEDEEYKIVFKDKTLIFKRDHAEHDLMLGGLIKYSKFIKEFNLKSFNSVQVYSALFNVLGMSILYVNEVKLLHEMFIDPITASILKELNLPETLNGLIIKANKELVNDNYINPNNVSGTMFKGYDRIPGIMYNEIVGAIREHQNKSYFGKSKVTVDPYSVIKKINNDSSTIIVDDLNPLASLKQKEEVVLTGSGGRSKDAINRDARAIHPTEIGIISEAAKDSGDVGITSQLSAVPNISSIRGKAKEVNNKDLEWSNILSSVGHLTPFADKEDAKRLGFAVIQASHVVPIDNMRAPYIRTGYESIVSLRSEDKFVTSSKDPGLVLFVSDKKVIIEHTDKNKKTYAKEYKLRKWTTKEESGGCYTHELISNVKKGDKLRTGDTILYDKLFYEPDIFDSRRVIFRSGSYVTVAVTESPETYEDSAGISKKMSKYLGTKVTKVKSIIVDVKDNILDMVKLNDRLTPNDVMFTIASSAIGDIDSLDDRAKAVLQNLKSSSPKAKVKGKVDNIIIYYNSEISDLSKSLKRIVKETDDRLKENTGYTGRVDSSYSINGVPLQEGQAEIKIYIEVSEGMGTGDKAILGNQLKFTVGEVYDYDILLEDGTPVDITFSNLAIAARIVNSPYLIGTTSSLLDKVSKNAVDIYFG